MMNLLRTALAVSLLLASPAVLAQHQSHSPAPAASGIAVKTPWARASAGMAPTGAAYVTLSNGGTVGDRLVAASSPAAGRVELHTHLRDGDVMRMRRVDAIDIPPGETESSSRVVSTSC